MYYILNELNFNMKFYKKFIYKDARQYSSLNSPGHTHSTHLVSLRTDEKWTPSHDRASPIQPSNSDVPAPAFAPAPAPGPACFLLLSTFSYSLASRNSA